MLSIPTSVFDRCIRSCLTFEEQHQTRRVAKIWADISKVEKKIAYSTPISHIPVNANFQNVTSLHAFFKDNLFEITQTIFSQSRKTLKSIDLYIDAEFSPVLPDCFENLTHLEFWGNALTFTNMVRVCPQLQNLHIDVDMFSFFYLHPNVETLSLWSEDESCNTAISSCLQSFPQVRTIEFTIVCAEYIIDFSDCRSSQSFVFQETLIWNVSFENIEMSSLKTITLSPIDYQNAHCGTTLKDFKEQLCNWILWFPSVHFSFPIWIYHEENVEFGFFAKVLIEVQQTELWFKGWVQNMPVEACSEKFADIVKSLLALQNYNCHIEMDDEEAENFTKVLKACGAFDDDQIHRFAAGPIL